MSLVSEILISRITYMISYLFYLFLIFVLKEIIVDTTFAYI